MWFYLIIFLITFLVYFATIGFGFYKKRENFFITETTTLTIIGVGLFIIELVLYCTNNYGFFILGLILGIFYTVLSVIVIKQKLFSKKTDYSY